MNLRQAKNAFGLQYGLGQCYLLEEKKCIHYLTIEVQDL